MKLSTKAGGIFIIGMRRTGTSILRKLVEQGTKGSILFEPHDFWFAIRRAIYPRITETAAWKAAAADIREHFDSDRTGGVRGIKLAFDPWTEGLEWTRIEDLFPEPRYIFIRRYQPDTFASYLKKDLSTDHGCAERGIHASFWNRFYQRVEGFAEYHPSRSRLIEYEDLVENPNETLAGLFEFLGHSPDIARLAAMVHRPENWTERE